MASASRSLGVLEQTLFNWLKAHCSGLLAGADSKPVSGEQIGDQPTASRAGAGEDGAKHSGKSDGALRQGFDLKYAFIDRHRMRWPVSVQCSTLGVSTAGFHDHMARLAAPAAVHRHLSDAALLVHIRAVHVHSRSSYGWPRLWRALLGQGIPVGNQRVQKLMQAHGITAKGKRRFKVTTDSGHNLPIAANLLNHEFDVSVPDTV